MGSILKAFLSVFADLWFQHFDRPEVIDVVDIGGQVDDLRDVVSSVDDLLSFSNRVLAPED